MEGTAIQLWIGKEPIILVSAYNPPGKFIERDLDLLLNIAKKVILAGDFNAKHIAWGSRHNNTAGQSLLSHYYQNNYIIAAPRHPTFYPDRPTLSPDILDIALLGNVLIKHKIRTLGHLANSDHRPVVLSLSSHFEPAEPKTTFMCRAANWDLYLPKHPMFNWELFNFRN
jgi:hypothetical protein